MENKLLQITNIRQEIKQQLDKIQELNQITELKTTYLGKKGPIQEWSNKLKDMSIEEKKIIGKELNELKTEIEDLFNTATKKAQEIILNKKLENDAIDITLPSTKINIGTLHPLTKVINEIEELFISMGYDVVSGPEIEQDLYNFELLNIPKDHPARDTQDSFYITEEYLLRTQTSPVQIRTMLSNKDKTPIRIICPGKTFRKDNDDKTHSHQFMQIEGLVVDKDITMSHLKGTLEELAKKLFGKEREIRFRPSFFPFTEPSFEIDVSCFNCGKKGCNLCKNTGWIEILGAGIVHPNVLKNCGYDPDIYRGFAFGVGPERVAMLKYGITDIRDFYTNDMRFIEQFNRTNGGDK